MKPLGGKMWKKTEAYLLLEHHYFYYLKPNKIWRYSYSSMFFIPRSGQWVTISLNLACFLLNLLQDWQHYSYLVISLIWQGRVLYQIPYSYYNKAALLF